MPHPYLYFTKNNVESFRDKIKTDDAAAKRYREAVKDADDLLKEPFVTEDFANGRDSLHGNFWNLGGQTNRMNHALGTKYLVEGDKACAEKLRALIRHFIGFERWHAESYCRRTPVPWHSDLCSTGMALAIATTYDLIYEELTPAERKEFAAGIFELGVKSAMTDWVFPETRLHAVDSMGHNWWAVCIGEAATALLALKDDLPGVDTNGVFALVNEALATYFGYEGNVLFNKIRNYDAGGLFYESIGYFEYGTATPLRYLWCYERCFGDNEVLRRAIPQNLGDALMSFSYPYTKDGKTEYAFMDFGDSDFFSIRDSLVKYLRRTGLDSAAVRAASALLPTELWDEIEGYSAACDDGSVNSLPKTVVFPSGYLLSRSTWEPDGTLFAVKSGYCWNHSHNDSGTFNIAFKGAPFITDGGRCGYDDPLYHAYYCQDCAHNVIRIGDEGRRDEELYRGTKFPGSVSDWREGEDFLFVQTDCTGPMAHLCSRLYRNFFWLDDNLLVIVDEIYCHKENTAEFTLHYMGECTGRGKGFLIADGERRGILTPVFPENMAAGFREGHMPQEPESKVPYLVLTTPEKARNHLLIHTLQLDDGTGEAAVTRITGENAEGVEIVHGGKTRQIWFNRMADGHVMHDNSNAVIAEYETDAYMLMITRRGDDPPAVLSVCGSYLRKDDRVLFSSFTKKTGLYR